MKKLIVLSLVVVFGFMLVGCGPSQNTSVGNVSNSSQSTLPVFTLNELAKYDGTHGAKAYVAVYGVVYDVTGIFINGYHQGMHLAGTDATKVFESSPHSKSMLSVLPVVGSLKGYKTIPAN